MKKRKLKGFVLPTLYLTISLTIFIGIISPIGCTIILYPYSKKELIIIRLIILKINLNI